MQVKQISQFTCANLEDLILQIAEKDSQIHRIIKIGCILSRQQCQDRLQKISDEKASWMCSKSSLPFEVIGAVCQMGAGFAGGQAAAKGAGLIGLGQGFNLVGNLFERSGKSHEEMCTHQYQHVSSIVSDHTQNLHAAEADIGKDHDLIARISQLSLQAMQALFSS